MSSQTGQRQIGRKIWYGVAIVLCVLVILLSVAGIVGIWVTGSALSSVTMQVLVVVENTADGLSTIVIRVDQGVARLEETSASISEATRQLSQNVTDKGLILTLLPEEREQELVAQANELQQTLDSVGETLKAGLELYQSIDNLPFVSLPKPEAQTVANFEQTIADVRASVQQVAQGIQDFRAGVSQEIGRVTGLVDEITARLQVSRQSLDQLNSRLEALQELAARLQELVTLIFTSMSILVSLFFGWIIYGQVEVIRLYVQRWKGLSDQTAASLLDEGQGTGELPETAEEEHQEAAGIADDVQADELHSDQETETPPTADAETDEKSEI
jgi:hypothetical protein